MTVFHDVKLEIVRPGPPHNQLLSPLTRYTALCGESGPVTFSIDLEQHELLAGISDLRYVVQDGREIREISEKSRQMAVNRMGQEVKKILAKLQNLLFEEGRALGQAISDQGGSNKGEHMVHLRLVSSASELANIPFEMAISPPATPAEGKRMLLDLNLPMVLTREIRRTRPTPVSWNSENPKILVIAAQPGFSTVPIKNHVRALRKSLKKWVEWPTVNRKNPSPNRLDEMRKRIRVLNDASIKSIYETCARDNFTHVHILAHGGSFKEAGEERFGLILCDPQDATKPHHVSGATLAKALQAEHREGITRSSPMMVTLATCDSGAQGSVLIPGGSLAYDLHVAGIPWVVASQFPLSKKGSTILTRELYTRIWRGDDPRKTLFEVRRILFARMDQMHDWASLVVYASFPKDSKDFDAQVTGFFESQTIAAIETAMKRADDISKAIYKAQETQSSDAAEASSASQDLWKDIETSLNRVEKYLQFWENRLPAGKDLGGRLSKGLFYGMSGSAYKRIALLKRSKPNSNEGGSTEFDPTYREYIRKALASYDRACDELVTDEDKFQWHWVATQYLFLKAVLSWDSEKGKKGNDRRNGSDGRSYARYEMSKDLAKNSLRTADSNSAKAWACGTLAELEMLSKHYKKSDRRHYTTITEEVRQHCLNLIENMGTDAFEAKSTLRQFNRYKLYWNDAEDGWIGKIADAAIEVLSAGY